MDLGLLDILAIQTADKPDYPSRADNNPPRPDANDGDFRTYLEKPKKTNNGEKFDTVEANFAAHDKVEPEANVASLGYQNTKRQNTSNNNSSSESEIGISQEGFSAGNENNLNGQAIGNIDGQLVNNLANVTNLAAPGEATQEELINAFNLLQNIKDSKVNAVSGDAAETLLPLQDVSVAQDTSQIVPVANIVNDLGTSISDAFNEIAENGLRSIATSQVAQAPNVANLGVTQDPNALNISELNPNNVNKLAGHIIDTAKNNAQAPEIVDQDIKSSQIASLLKGQEAKDNNVFANNPNQNNIVTNQINLAGAAETNQKIGHEQGNAQAIAQTLQNSIDDDAANNERLAKAIDANGNNNGNAPTKAINETSSNSNDSGTNNGFANKGTDILTQSSINNNNNIAGTNDFMKFQKYVDSAENSVKNIAGNNNAKAQDVISQIKFGISSVSNKGDSKITIQLHPKELGSVDVHMELGKNGKTKIAIMAEKVDTLNLLQKDSASLKNMLQDALQTSSADLSFSFHENNDHQWKEMINEVYGNSYSADTEIDEDHYSNMATYSQNFVATEGLDIQV